MSLILKRLDKLRMEIDEEDLRILLSNFKCSAEPAAENFLKKIAIRHDRESISRTYLVLEHDHESERDLILGFFTLAIKCLSIEESDIIPEYILEQMNLNNRVAQAFLLGQLAKADGVEKGFGGTMIKVALATFSKGKEMFGCRVVRLDCRDRMIGYYESFGFSVTKKSKDNTLNQMVLII